MLSPATPEGRRSWPEPERNQAESEALWDKACLIARIVSANVEDKKPYGLNGVWLETASGPIHDAWFDYLKACLSPQTPLIKIGAHTEPDFLTGGIDLEATLHAGKIIEYKGLFESKQSGIIALYVFENLNSSLIKTLISALDKGWSIIAINEGEDSAPAHSMLMDRLPLRLSLNDIAWHAINPTVLNSLEVPTITGNWCYTKPNECIVLQSHHETISALSIAFGHQSLWPSLAMMRIAQLNAAMEDRSETLNEDIELAVALICGPIQTQEPSSEQEKQIEPDLPDPTEPNKSDTNAKETVSDYFKDLTDIIVKANQSEKINLEIPHKSFGPSKANGPQGRKSKDTTKAKRGRPLGYSSRPPYQGARPNISATLRAAATWQKIRRNSQKETSKRVIIRKSDFRYRTFENPISTLTIFVVDASGSTALDRLADTKGTIEALLADSYIKRDQVALVAFRGDKAQTLLAPTRALAKAKRALDALPGGGATPLASAMQEGLHIALNAKKRGERPLLVLLTDGRGNIALDGTSNKQNAHQDVETLSKHIRANQIETVIVDIAKRPRGHGQKLAEMINCTYKPLPFTNTQALTQIVQSAQMSLL